MKKTIILFAIMLIIAAASVSAKTYTFETGQYSIEEVDGYEIVSTPNTEPYHWDGDLVRLEAVFQLKFPQTQVVDEIRLVEFRDPVELTLNLPTAYEKEPSDPDSWDYEYGYAERDCIYETFEPEFFVNDPFIMGDEATYAIEIYPLEILDCGSGRVKLYRTVEYESVLVQSTARIDYAGIPDSAAPGSVVSIPVVMNQDVDGILRITDIIDEVVVSRPISGDRDIISFKASEDYDRIEYLLEYAENGKTIAYKDFILYTTWGQVDFQVYESDNPLVIPIKVNATNNHPTQIEVQGTLELVDWDSVTTKTINFSRMLSPGDNVFSMNVDATEATKENDLRITLEYDGHEESIMHNTIMRIDPERAEKAQEEYQRLQKERQEQEISSSTSKSNLLGIIIALALFAALGYFAIRYMKKE